MGKDVEMITNTKHIFHQSAHSSHEIWISVSLHVRHQLQLLQLQNISPCLFTNVLFGSAKVENVEVSLVSANVKSCGLTLSVPCKFD